MLVNVGVYDEGDICKLLFPGITNAVVGETPRARNIVRRGSDSLILVLLMLLVDKAKMDVD